MAGSGCNIPAVTVVRFAGGDGGNATDVADAVSATTSGTRPMANVRDVM